MCIDRRDMPQIDLIHLDEFFKFCIHHGVKVKEGPVPPRLCKPVQCVRFPMKHVSPPTLVKPVLLAEGWNILDGNTRWGTWLQRGAPHMPASTIGLRFADAVKLMWMFPHTYRYGDGKFHPRTF